ncbi:MAG: flagellar biosynthesis protein FlhB [Treponema sp.]|jgi:flagellar biosynthetic protein FlhB|nr:flagellar biosynthesis protein FlhB [Treponema sp.]
MIKERLSGIWDPGSEISDYELGIRDQKIKVQLDNICYLQICTDNEIKSPVYNSRFPVIPLQWFADDNDEDAPGKTEPPTDEKLRRLREEGQVVKSQELVGAIGLLLPAILLIFLAPSMLRTCAEMIRFYFLRILEMDPTKDALIVVVFFRYLVVLAAPILIVAFISAIFSNMIQLGGWLFTTKPLEPNFSKTLPKFGQYFKRIFSSEGLFNLLKSLAKIAIIGFVAYLFISSDIQQLLNLQKADLYSGLVLVAGIAVRMLLVVAVLLLVLGIVDYYFQRWRFRERHKMTKYEIKEERKMYEADPMIQARIRSRFREMLRQNIHTAVPKADVVITNPTHLAVALQYERTMEGPRVVAMGADTVAVSIREIAKEHGVPLVENKPLAQALYRETDVGDIIPEAYFNTVATILSKVWRLNEARRENAA